MCLEGRCFKTKPAQKGSKNPEWNYSTSIVIDEVIHKDMMFKISVYDKNKYSKDNLIGENTVNLDYLQQVQKIEDADYRIYHKDKEVGMIFVNFHYSGPDEEHPGIAEEREDSNPLLHQIYSNQPQMSESEDLEYDYQPIEKSKSESHNNPKNSDEKIIAIDSSLSPLEANLVLNNTAIWFKFDSSEVYNLDFNTCDYESVMLDSSHQLNYNFRATELPDSSFLITGGSKSGVYSQQTLHFFYRKFIKKSEMTVARSGHVTIYHKGFVYCFGGINSSGAHNNCEAFDMNSDEWLVMPAMPRNRFNAGCCKFGEGKAYVFGGTESEGGAEENDINHANIDVYDTNTYEWQTLGVKLSSPIAFPVCVQIGSSEILIMGGREANGVCKREVYLLNTRTCVKTQQEDMMLPCFSIYPPVYRGDSVFIQNSGTEIDNVPDTMIYLFSKLK